MSGIDNGLLRSGAWASVYLLVLLQHIGLTHVVLRQPIRAVGAWPRWPGWGRMVGILLAGATGAMIPLLPESWPVGEAAVHLWGDLDGSLLLVWTVHWAAMTLLSLQTTPSRWGHDDESIALAAARLSVQVVLAMLLLFGLLMVRGMLDGLIETRLTVWMSARGPWLALTQPIAFLIWLGVVAPPRRDAGGRALPGGELLALNHALLTATFFLGGMSGPFVQRMPWLGGLYLALKADLVTILSVWLSATVSAAAGAGNVRGMWRVAVPVATINLILTALVLAWLQAGR